jgi:hypothetical protein
MTRILRNLAFILSLTTAGVGLGALGSMSDGPAAAQSGGFTPLPPGWELCVLEGVTAPATAPNIADLDEWQAAEGGSTNNTAAFNPYNTLRMTDVTGTRLPGATSANGFPAFPTWAAGCAATVATLLQPNMLVITAALRAGNVTPQAAFLAVVDQSSWCAPSPDGVPCYVDAMRSSPGSSALAVPASSALAVYGDVSSDLQSYEQSIAAVTRDQGAVESRTLALELAESMVKTDRAHLGAASHALQGFAVSEYVSTGLYSGASLDGGPGIQAPTPNTPQTPDGVVAQQYIHVAASNLVTKSDAATAAVSVSEQHRDEEAAALATEASTLTSDEAAENSLLLQLMSDLATLKNASTCTTITIAPPVTTANGTSGSTAATVPSTIDLPTASTTTTTVPSTATTTTVPSTTTTTTDPSDPSTTTTTSGPVPSTTIIPSATTTTTVPSTATTATAVPSTATTTTTVPAVASAGTATASTEAPGVLALQGCIATIAPPVGA